MNRNESFFNSAFCASILSRRIIRIQTHVATANEQIASASEKSFQRWVSISKHLCAPRTIPNEKNVIYQLNRKALEKWPNRRSPTTFTDGSNTPQCFLRSRQIWQSSAFHATDFFIHHEHIIESSACKMFFAPWRDWLLWIIKSDLCFRSIVSSSITASKWKSRQISSQTKVSFKLWFEEWKFDVKTPKKSRHLSTASFHHLLVYHSKYESWHVQVVRSAEPHDQKCSLFKLRKQDRVRSDSSCFENA